MSLKLIRAIATAENLDEFHLGRILLLLSAADGKKSKSIEGITKLAKLDFLLRYPNCLERALEAVGKKAESAQIQPYERTTIESKMIRFKYGPWDDRYRRWIALLASRDLLIVELKGRTVYLRLTETGRDIARIFSGEPAYRDLSMRSQLVYEVFGAKSASQIKDFVYQVFPELETMRWGEEITL
jgi:hypothetical protein